MSSRFFARDSAVESSYALDQIDRMLGLKRQLTLEQDGAADLSLRYGSSKQKCRDLAFEPSAGLPDGVGDWVEEQYITCHSKNEILNNQSGLRAGGISRAQNTKKRRQRVVGSPRTGKQPRVSDAR